MSQLSHADFFTWFLVLSKCGSILTLGSYIRFYVCWLTLSVPRSSRTGCFPPRMWFHLSFCELALISYILHFTHSCGLRSSVALVLSCQSIVATTQSNPSQSIVTTNNQSLHAIVATSNPSQAVRIPSQQQLIHRWKQDSNRGHITQLQQRLSPAMPKKAKSYFLA